MLGCWKPTEDDVKVSKHFKLKEFLCPCELCEFQTTHMGRLGKSVIYIDTVLVGALEAVRTAFNSPLHINSGYRCEEHNATLENSSPSSKHIQGQAVDISLNGLSPSDKARLEFLMREHFTYVYKKEGFIHGDVRQE